MKPYVLTLTRNRGLVSSKLSGGPRNVLESISSSHRLAELVMVREALRIAKEDGVPLILK